MPSMSERIAGSSPLPRYRSAPSVAQLGFPRSRSATAPAASMISSGTSWPTVPTMNASGQCESSRRAALLISARADAADMAGTKTPWVGRAMGGGAALLSAISDHLPLDSLSPKGEEDHARAHGRDDGSDAERRLARGQVDQHAHEERTDGGDPLLAHRHERHGAAEGVWRRLTLRCAAQHALVDADPDAEQRRRHEEQQEAGSGGIDREGHGEE